MAEQKRLDSSMNILSLIYEIQGLAYLEPKAYLGSKPISPNEMIQNSPDLFVQMSRQHAKKNWGKLESKIISLKTEAYLARAIYNKDIADQIITLCSSLRALDPEYIENQNKCPIKIEGVENYIDPTPNKTLTKAILSIPNKIDRIEDELTILNIR
jgi:hypothetical protein